MTNKKWRNGTLLEKSMRTKKIDEYKYVIKHNKKDKYNELLSERIPMACSNVNPFFKSENYIHDLQIQNNFLIPQNSNN